MYVTLSNFMFIGQTLNDIWRFLISKNGGPMLNLSYACLDHPRRVFSGLSHCAKFGWIRRSSFDNMQILIFCALGLKMPT